MQQQFQKQLQTIKTFFHHTANKFDEPLYEYFPRLRSLQIRPSYLATVLAFFFWGLYIVGLIVIVISKLFVLFIPVYTAYKQLREKTPDTFLLGFWLKYFLVYVVWELAESVVVNFYEIGPIYSMLKVAVLLAMYQRPTNTLEGIFSQIVQWIQPHEPKLDQNLAALKGSSLGAGLSGVVEKIFVDSNRS